MAATVELVQGLAAARLRSFTPRPPPDVHATIVSLSSPAHPHPYTDAEAGVLRTFLRETFDRAPLDARFGGFAAGDRRFTSRGSPPYVRSLEAALGKVVVIGWPDPATGGRDRLGRIRQACGDLGFVHDYHRDGAPLDTDLYAVVGEVDPDEPVGAFLDEGRAALSRSPTRIRVDADALRFVTYEDTRLPAATSHAERL